MQEKKPSVAIDYQLSDKQASFAQFRKKPKSEPLSIHIYDTICVFGMKGSGKTFLVQNGLIPAIDRLIVYDGEHDYPEENVSWDGKGKGEFSRWYMFHDFHSLVKHLIKMSREKNVRKKSKIVYRPKDNTSMAEFDFFCRCVYTFGNYYISVDEFHNYLPSRAGRIPRWVAQVLRLGRHKNIGFIGISQRPADVNTAFKGLASKAFIFRLVFSHDVKYMVDWFGRALESVRELDGFRFIYFDGKNLFQCDKLNVDDEEAVEVDPEPAGKTGKKQQTPDESEEEEILSIVEEIEEVF